MKEDNYYETNVDTLWQVAEDLGLSREDIPVLISQDYWMSVTLGANTTKERMKKKVSADNILHIHHKNLSDVVGGVDVKNFKRSRLEGVKYIGHGMCELDMNAGWVKKNNITHDDFYSASEKFVKASHVKKALSRKTINGGKMKEKYPGQVFKCGRIWIFSKNLVDNLVKAQRSAKRSGRYAV